jgi:diacylglycerol kinase
MNEWCTKFMKSFHCAGQGIKFGFKDRNMKIHGAMALLVIVVGWYLKLSTVDWAIILILIGLVFMAELINTSLEQLANVVKKNNSLDYEATRVTRDLAAGAVLIIAAVSAVVGLIIFLSKIFSLYSVN